MGGLFHSHRGCFGVARQNKVQWANVGVWITQSKGMTMSGIILPGQDKEPKPQGGIELPRGYGRRAQEKPQEAPAPATPPAETGTQGFTAPSASPGSRPGRQPAGRGPELLFPPQGARVQCPSCGTPYVVPVFSIIDLGANPELKAPLLSGQINVAVCPNCGTGGALGAPLLVHDPEHQFLGIYAPAELNQQDMQLQKAIGDLTQALMRKLPPEARKGYLLQPRQFLDWQSFVEKLWEFEGVTPEMLRRQRDQSELLQRLSRLVDDDKALEIALERSAHLIDQDFFSLLDQLTLLMRGQGQMDQASALLKLREKLLETTPAGQEVKARQQRVRQLLERIQGAKNRNELLSIVLEAWQEPDGQQMVGSLAIATGGQLMDYQFLMALSERIGATQDPEARKRLEELRQFILEVQQQIVAQQQQSQESAAQQAQALLQEVLQAQDPRAVLQENADLVDETFLALLAANLQAAERNKATAAARRLRQIYELALKILQENMPEELQLLNDLLAAPDDATVRRLLKEKRPLLTREFLDSLTPLEAEMRQGGRADIADRIKSLRGQIALMM